MAGIIVFGLLGLTVFMFLQLRLWRYPIERMLGLLNRIEYKFNVKPETFYVWVVIVAPATIVFVFILIAGYVAGNFNQTR